MIEQILFYVDIAVIALVILSFIFMILSRKHEEKKDNINIILLGLIFLLVVLLISFSGYFLSGEVLNYLIVASKLVFVPLVGIFFVGFLVLLRE